MSPSISNLNCRLTADSSRTHTNKSSFSNSVFVYRISELGWAFVLQCDIECGFRMRKYALIFIEVRILIDTWSFIVLVDAKDNLNVHKRSTAALHYIMNVEEGAHLRQTLKMNK